MTASAPSAAATTTSGAPGAAAGHTTDSTFEPSTFGALSGRDAPTRWIGWRRRGLVLAALLGCLVVFALARVLSAAHHVDATWSANAEGRLVLQSSPLAELAPYRGHVVLAARGAGLQEVVVDALALHHSARWQVNDSVRVRQVAQRQALATALNSGRVELRFDDGRSVSVASPRRGYATLGLVFWPLAGLGLLVYLFGVVLLLARPRWTSVLFVMIALAQAANLWLSALEAAPGLGLAAATLSGNFTLRVMLDLISAAASLHALTLVPRRLSTSRPIALAGWALVLGWLVLAQAASSGALDPPGSMWLWAQAAALLLGVGTLLAVNRSYRLEPNPYALVMRRFALAAVLTFLLTTLAVAATADWPGTGAQLAEGASVAWYLFFASLLLLTPTLARTRQVLREFALLAGISTVATSLDLLFVAVFSLGSYTSLAMAMFIALGLYAGARQWVVSHLLGSSMLTTERTFDQLYRAARALRSQPQRYGQVLASLMNELFEPLEVQRVDRVPARSRVIAGGAALVVPIASAEDDGTPAQAVALRFANRGQRLFTLDDARLADRMVDQLRRAAAYDQAVERGRTEERQRLAQDLHDDIGARLLTLMYQAPTREMEDYIRHTLQDLKTLTRGLAAPEHRLSHAAAEWKSDLTQRLAAARATLGWSFSFDEDIQLSVVQWSALTRVLRELVSNALFHGHATRIDVHFVLEKSQLTLQVADDGGGADPAAWAHGLGLGGVRKRVKLLGGKVAWRENTPQGIVCAVRVADFTQRG